MIANFNLLLCDVLQAAAGLLPALNMPTRHTAAAAAARSFLCAWCSKVLCSLKQINRHVRNVTGAAAPAYTRVFSLALMSLHAQEHVEVERGLHRVQRSVCCSPADLRSPSVCQMNPACVNPGMHK